MGQPNTQKHTWRLECPVCQARWGASCERKAYQSADDHARRLGEQHKVRVTHIEAVPCSA